MKKTGIFFCGGSVAWPFSVGFGAATESLCAFLLFFCSLFLLGACQKNRRRDALRCGLFSVCSSGGGVESLPFLA